MNKALPFLIIALVIISGLYFYISSNSEVQETEVVMEPISTASNPQNATYNIGGEPVTLVDGSSEQLIPDSSSKIETKYFGNDVSLDLDNDGREDSVFLLTQSTGGTGTFFYVVAALNTEDGWIGSEGVLLGDRIAPQTTEVSTNPNHKNVIVVNYMDRAVDEPMTAQPSVGKSIWLKLDTATLQFGEVEGDFEGEASPEMMSLNMKSWTWVKTTYSNGTEIAPKNTNAFTITFAAENVSIATDCNTMSGPYEAKNGQILFGSNMISTMMFCEDSQEQDFAKMLLESQTYTFTSKGELVLGLKNDSGSVILK